MRDTKEREHAVKGFKLLSGGLIQRRIDLMNAITKTVVSDVSRF